jgi:hypothetical protein
LRYFDDFSLGQVLVKWYADHSAVRRLRAIEEPQRIRVVVSLAPTNDGDDTYPIWLANSREWADELQSHMHGPVHLERMDEVLFAELVIDRNGVLVADLTWRDPGSRSD